MKWILLKIFQANLVQQEVDIVNEKYTSKKNKIKLQISIIK